MSLVRIDWNPSAGKIRQFGALLVLLALVTGGFMLRGHRPGAFAVLCGGVVLGLLAAALPGTLGRWIYKAWMGVAFVLGTITSFVLLALMYFAVLTPAALFLRLRRRDALRLARPETDSYWIPIETPDDIAAYERPY